MKFAEGTQRISEGDLDYQIDFKTDDEIGTLIKSFILDRVGLMSAKIRPGTIILKQMMVNKRI